MSVLGATCPAGHNRGRDPQGHTPQPYRPMSAGRHGPGQRGGLQAQSAAAHWRAHTAEVHLPWSLLRRGGVKRRL
eukprot:3554528-Pleurochrysis_carterae.AAC.1